MGISIHALLAESDRGAYIMKMIAHHFYPRSPCGERLTLIQKIAHLCLISIHALLAESDCGCCARCHCWGLFLSTLSLRRATVSNVATGIPFSISIHALLAESDRGAYIMKMIAHHFYPRSPCGERLTLIQKIAHLCLISIHALLAESDYSINHITDDMVAFLSTLSLRRATP